MSLSDDERWILPENLKRQQEREVRQVEQGLSGEVGDFGSYHALLTGKDKELVKAHAVLDAAYLRSYARQARSILKSLGCSKSPQVLDAGCGPGGSRMPWPMNFRKATSSA